MERLLLCGVFDLFHAGHAYFLKKVHDEHPKMFGERCEIHIGLPIDADVKRFKRKPIYAYMDRAFILKSNRYVTDVHQFSLWTQPPYDLSHQEGHRVLIEKVRPKYFVESRQKEKSYIGMLPFLEAYNIEIGFVDSIDIHTTDIIEFIRTGQHTACAYYFPE